MLIGDNGQQPLQAVVGELRNPSAADADKMVMMRLGRHRFVTEEPLAEVLRPHQAAFHKELDGPVDGREANRVPLFAQSTPNLVHREVILGEQHDFGHSIALAGYRLVMVPEVAVKPVEEGRTLTRRESRHRSPGTTR